MTNNLFKLIVKAIIVTYFGSKLGEWLNKILDIDLTARAVNEDRKKAKEAAENAAYTEAKRVVRRHERKAKKERKKEVKNQPFQRNTNSKIK